MYVFDRRRGVPTGSSDPVAPRTFRLHLARKLIAPHHRRAPSSPSLARPPRSDASFIVATGKILGICDRDLRHLHVAGLLHDLGKIGVPDDILRQPGPLDARPEQR